MLMSSSAQGTFPSRGMIPAAQDLMRKLQALLDSELPAVYGTAVAADEVHALSGGQKKLSLEVSPACVTAVKVAVRRAAGPCSRGILRHLDDVVSAVRTGGVKVRLPLAT
jgi:hypothetical protein